MSEKRVRKKNSTAILTYRSCPECVICGEKLSNDSIKSSMKSHQEKHLVIALVCLYLCR